MKRGVYQHKELWGTKMNNIELQAQHAIHSDQVYNYFLSPNEDAKGQLQTINHWSNIILDTRFSGLA
jgi:hypothetical protein